LDYLDGANLSAAKLLRRIEWAVIRNGHRLPGSDPRTGNTADRDRKSLERRQTLDGLPPRERQVLELLASGLTPKQIAARCGTRSKTVWTQLAKLRFRFNVNSNHALSVLNLSRADA
jgi:DNA-binding CsgD family transcriptional regulator